MRTIRRRPVGPRWLPALLVVVATLLAVVGATTTWLRVQLLDTDQWVTVSNALLEEPDVRSALSSHLRDQLFEAVDVRAELEGLLPPRLEGLAGPLNGLVRVAATSAVEQTLASERFGDLWEAANRRTHTAVVAVLRGEDVGPLSTADGAITLELGEALERIGERLGLPAAALERLPPEFGRIEVADPDDLAGAQRVVRVAEVVSWVVLLGVIALYAAAITLAVGRRVEVMLKIGIAVVIGSFALLVTRVLGVRVAISSLIRQTENESVATAVGMVATELLRDMAWTGIAVGVVIALTAALLGEGPRVAEIRANLRWLATSTGLVVAAAILVVVGLTGWALDGPFDRPALVATLIVAIVGGGVLVARRIRAEGNLQPS